MTHKQCVSGRCPGAWALSGTRPQASTPCRFFSGGARGSAEEQAVQDQPVADADTVVPISGQQAPGAAEGPHDTAPAAAAAAAEPPAADDAADGSAEQQEGAEENQGECADDDWPQGRRFREPHAAQPEEGEEPAEAEAEAGPPPEEVLPPEEIQVPAPQQAASSLCSGSGMLAPGGLRTSSMTRAINDHLNRRISLRAEAHRGGGVAEAAGQRAVRGGQARGSPGALVVY